MWFAAGDGAAPEEGRWEAAEVMDDAHISDGRISDDCISDDCISDDRMGGAASVMTARDSAGATARAGG
jgi:hypothetical protein